MDEMSLEEFLAHWDVDRKELALICECSVSTVDHWFMQGKSRRHPDQGHCRRLADVHRELSRMQMEPSRFEVYRTIKPKT